MRLTEFEISNIKEVISSHDPNSEIYLFGSRADDSKRGGDIDLLIISPELEFKQKRAIRMELHRRLGEQKIDITIVPDTTTPFSKIATENGVKL